jgi:hypothetical protein
MLPTLRTLSKIRNVYGLSLGYFFSDPAKHTLPITRRGHMEVVRSQREVVRQIPLRCGTASRFNAVILEFPGRLLEAASDPRQGLACLIYVVEGRLQLDVGGMREVLEAGDCACLETGRSLGIGGKGCHLPGAVRQCSSIESSAGGSRPHVVLRILCGGGFKDSSSSFRKASRRGLLHGKTIAPTGACGNPPALIMRFEPNDASCFLPSSIPRL